MHLRQKAFIFNKVQKDKEFLRAVWYLHLMSKVFFFRTKQARPFHLIRVSTGRCVQYLLGKYNQYVNCQLTRRRKNKKYLTH